jgi:pSer/pThr/pTyr-binding forkhead associated (FHA) protein
MQVVLAMFKSDGDRRSFSLHKDITVIGRREDCDLRIPLGEISRKHCRLIKDGQSLRVEDLGSSNGTYHNGERVQEAVIQPGDTVQVGSIAFVIQIDGTPVDEELHPTLAAEAAAPQAIVEDSGAAEVLDESDSATASASADGQDNSAGTGAGADSTASAAQAAAPDSAEGEFDPMSILERGDSQLPGDAMAIDVEQSHHGQNAER